MDAERKEIRPEAHSRDDHTRAAEGEGAREVRIPIVEEEVTVRKVPRVKEEIIIRIERETVMEEREVEIRRERVEVVPDGEVEVEGPDDLVHRTP